MRMPRLDHPGARHHVMNRGAGRRTIFPGAESRQTFLDLLADLSGRFHVRVHGYAIMPNHYHLLVESGSGHLGRAMGHLGRTYSRWLNQEVGTDGPVFRGRYKNRVVGTDDYWRHLLAYVHLNPVRAGLSSPSEAHWTSHGAYVGTAARPAWLHTAELQQLFGSQQAYEAYYQAVYEGRQPPPPDFDPDRLWRSKSTGTVAIPQPSDDTFAVADALEEVCRVTGHTLDQVLEKPMGRSGNAAQWIAAWWMSRGRGIPHRRIAGAMGLDHSGVSQRIRRVERRLATDAQLAAWAQALRAM